MNKAIHAHSLGTQDIARIVGVSIVFDLIEAFLDTVPVVGWIINIGIDAVAWVTFYFLFKRRGVEFNSAKRFLFFSSGFILDLVPFINMFAWTLDVLLVIGTVKREEGMQDGRQGGRISIEN
jgi:hypothetical protein